MIALLFSVLCSSFLFVLFKLFPKYNIDTFQAIVVNYFTAFLCGIILFKNEWKTEVMDNLDWIYYAIGSAVLFISLFILMGKSSQSNGVAQTSVAVKMSMAVSVVCMILWYNEPLSFWKIGGVLLACTGVYLVSKNSNKEEKSSSATWMLPVLFLGSGALDFLLNYVQNYHLEVLTPSLFSAFGFGIAGIIGSFFLAIKVIRKRAQLEWRNVIAGIFLGIPNFFSIYLLIVSYTSTGWDDSSVLAIINVSVVLISAVLGFIVFRERVSLSKILGLVAAIAAILFLFLSNQ
jgi:drug/metabolite transporter (DMT)-like permease